MRDVTSFRYLLSMNILSSCRYRLFKYAGWGRGWRTRYLISHLSSVLFLIPELMRAEMAASISHDNFVKCKCKNVSVIESTASSQYTEVRSALQIFHLQCLFVHIELLLYCIIPDE